MPPTFFAMSYSFIKCFIFDIDDTYTITNTPPPILKKKTYTFDTYRCIIGLKYFTSILIKIIIFLRGSANASVMARPMRIYYLILD